MVSIGVLGYGVVGSGVVDLLQKNSERLRQKLGVDLNVLKVLVRNLDKYNDAGSLLTIKEEEVIHEKVDIVIEVMGGIHPAYDYVKKALKMKKHVITANKDLVAAHGEELMALALENQVCFAYEASVGGGIPIIRPMTDSLAANEISQITAILNGTTNFILTKMYKEDMDYGHALREAQQLGFAEANPESDVMGYDAARKLSILSTLAYDQKIDWKDIDVEGITEIDAQDIKYAKKLGCVIKLLAISRKNEKGVFAAVRPVMVSEKGPFGQIDNEFNGIRFEGDAIGEMMFIGKGAGKLPTASAVVGDIIHIVQNYKGKHGKVTAQGQRPSLKWEHPFQWMLRIKTNDRYKVMGSISELFAINNFMFDDAQDKGEVICVVEIENEQSGYEKLQELQSKGYIQGIKKMMKLEEMVS
ncbi:MAG: homoserine dehydrogenase [Anaerosolibacter sp.]|jgi:homoserine dehydrogenase|uniref:homoserine dehydrogenase n=1 Tax=Anaerosolibacter sp. TaxID=1872527 RepID=UPI0026228CC3|nr:homoserine dehydrogenase [Anaerosolibacter sp.]MDF2548850.1 homoserine dehydrogenase [Anaerosolibacter sp.]